MDYRRDYDALRARVDGLERELAELRTELEAARAGAGAAGMKRLRDELAVARAALAGTQRELAALREATRGVDVAALRKEATAARRELKALRKRLATDHSGRQARIDAAEAAAATAAVETRRRTAAQASVASARKPAGALGSRALLTMANEAYVRGDLDRAQGLCRELLERTGLAGADFSRATVYLLLARILVDKKRPNQAIEMLGRGLMAEPHHAKLREAMNALTRKQR
ncbi:MAG: hypothetical protein IT370_23185 [Deltaproteobacteria bacterium]|nr:hypothetical protein [Deltaproteobacteria bacterium]